MRLSAQFEYVGLDYRIILEKTLKQEATIDVFNTSLTIQLRILSVL